MPGWPRGISVQGEPGAEEIHEAVALFRSSLEQRDGLVIVAQAQAHPGQQKTTDVRVSPSPFKISKNRDGLRLPSRISRPPTSPHLASEVARIRRATKADRVTC